MVNSDMIAYLKMAAPLKRTWNKHAIGWLAVEKIPKSLF